MKTIMGYLKILGLSITLMTFYSCDNDDDEIIAQEGQLIATINGNPFIADITNVGALLVNEGLGITAFNPSSNERLFLSITNIESEGDFNIGNDSEGNSMGVGVYTINDNFPFLSTTEGGTGIIRITSLNLEENLISGTFEFRGSQINDNGEITSENVEIADGSFTNIPIEITTAGNPENEFNVNINGVTFNTLSVASSEVIFNGNTTINILANDNDTGLGQTVGIAIPNTLSIGTHNFSPSPSNTTLSGLYSVVTNDSSLSLIALEGTLTITNIDTTINFIEGVFEFTAGDETMQNSETFELTNGAFSVIYQ